jgi:hypothetical protein
VPECTAADGFGGQGCHLLERKRGVFCRAEGGSAGDEDGRAAAIDVSGDVFGEVIPSRAVVDGCGGVLEGIEVYRTGEADARESEEQRHRSDIGPRGDGRLVACEQWQGNVCNGRERALEIVHEGDDRHSSLGAETLGDSDCLDASAGLADRDGGGSVGCRIEPVVQELARVGHDREARMRCEEGGQDTAGGQRGAHTEDEDGTLRVAGQSLGGRRDERLVLMAIRFGDPADDIGLCPDVLDKAHVRPPQPRTRERNIITLA